MNANAHLSLLSLLFFFSANAYSAIEVTNYSGQNIRVSFQGDGCRLFDSDRFNYAPCVEKEISVNETAYFPTFIHGTESLTKNERSIIPRIIFSSLGLSYVCKVHEFLLDQMCGPAFSSKKADQCQRPSQDVKELSSPIPVNTFMLLNVAGLSIAENFSLHILEGYGYFPQPYVDCDVTQLDESKCPNIWAKP